MAAFSIRADDLSSSAVRELLRLHLSGMHENSPPGHVFALDLSGLQAPGVSVYTAHGDGRLAGIGALKRLGGCHAEIKSMRTHAAFLRQGAAAALLDHMLGVAEAEGITDVSLETGSGPTFDPAIALYRSRGFSHGAPFAEYVQSSFNRFLHKRL